MRPVRLWHFFFVIASVPSSWTIARPPGHGYHPPLPDKRLYFQCRIDLDGEPRVVEVALAIKSPMTAAKLDQVIQLPAPLPPIRLCQYLPKALLEQNIVPDNSAAGKPALLISIDGPTQSFQRWLVADEPARNRLISLIGTWRYMSVANKQQRDDLFEQFKNELHRPPRLLVSRTDGSDLHRLPVKTGTIYSLDELGCKVRILSFYSHYGLDKKINKPVNLSDKRINPAALIEIEHKGKKQQRWVFARFPDFKAHKSDIFAYRITLDCPTERSRPVPDFVLVTIGRASHELWSRRDGKIASEPIDLKRRVKVTGSQYTFHLAQFVPSGKLVETYRPTKNKTGVPVLQIETNNGSDGPATFWLELGKQRVLPTAKGHISVVFGPRRVSSPPSQEQTHRMRPQ